MTPTRIGLRSNSGDAPGNLREVMTRLPDVGTVCAVSDIHYRKPAQGESAIEYGVAAELDTERTNSDIRSTLQAIVNAVASRVARSARFGVNIDVIAEAENHGHHPESETSIHPVVFVATSSIDTRPESGDALARERAQELPAEGRRSIVRVPHTARLDPAPRFDYDTIGDARSKYHDVRPLTRFDRELFHTVSASIRLKPGLRVMDVGCGTGRFSALLAAAHAAVTGVDRSANMLAVAREEPRTAQFGINYVCMDANVELPSGPFDAITFFFSLQYMSLASSFWQRLHSSLVPGGVVAFASFPHAHFVQTEHARFFPSIPSIDMARFPSVPRLCVLLHDNGFKQVTVEDVVSHEKTPASTLVTRTAARYLSTFHLLMPEEFEHGLAAMRAAYAKDETVARTIRAAVITARRHDTAER